MWRNLIQDLQGKVTMRVNEGDPSPFLDVLED
jgi:hypothetical protein